MFDPKYDAEAATAWESDPKDAMRKYGLPCWCGHYGGCERCESDLDNPVWDTDTEA